MGAVVGAGAGDIVALDVAGEYQVGIEANVEGVSGIDGLETGGERLPEDILRGRYHKAFMGSGTVGVGQGVSRISRTSWANTISSVPSNEGSLGDDR